MSKKSDYRDALLKDMSDNIKTILEVVIPTKHQVDKIPKIEEDIAEIRGDIKVIKAAAIKTNQNVADLDRRVGRLEAKTA